jgi:beta-lactamase class A
MATILNNIDHGPLISQHTRYNGLNNQTRTRNHSLLVRPLPPEVRVAHKTGDIGTALGDSGIFYLPDGRKYILSIQVERPFNDYTPRDMIQKASRMVYEYVISQPQPATLASGRDDSARI